MKKAADLSNDLWTMMLAIRAWKKWLVAFAATHSSKVLTWIDLLEGLERRVRVVVDRGNGTPAESRAIHREAVRLNNAIVDFLDPDLRESVERLREGGSGGASNDDLSDTQREALTLYLTMERACTLLGVQGLIRQLEGE